MSIEHEELARIYKVMGDPKRLQILNMLSEGEKCACQLQVAFNVSQPTLSHDMKQLCQSGLVDSRKEGKWVHYSLNREKLELVAAATAAILDDKTKEINGMNNSANTRIYVLTGFLGSGKTTLLLKILEHLKGHRVGVIQNEFGKLSIDGDIIRDDDIQMIEICRGSIFCSCLKKSFVEALCDMSNRDFEYLFVESSGLGDPSNVQEIIDAAEEASGKKFDFGGVICMVDAANFLEQVEDEETVNRQLKHCHLAAITKSDLVDGETIEKITEKIRSINPVCLMETSTMGSLDLGFMKEDLLLYQWAEGEESINSKENKPKTLSMEFEGEVEREALVAFLNEIIPSLYRSKGFFNIKGEGWMQVDVVGRNIDFKPSEAYEKSHLVFISKIGAAVIKPLAAAWEAKVGQPMKLKN